MFSSTLHCNVLGVTPPADLRPRHVNIEQPTNTTLTMCPEPLGSYDPTNSRGLLWCHTIIRLMTGIAPPPCTPPVHVGLDSHIPFWWPCSFSRPLQLTLFLRFTMRLLHVTACPPSPTTYTIPRMLTRPGNRTFSRSLPCGHLALLAYPSSSQVSPHSPLHSCAGQACVQLSTLCCVLSSESVLSNGVFTVTPAEPPSSLRISGCR